MSFFCLRIKAPSGTCKTALYHVIAPAAGGHKPINWRIVTICPRWWLLCIDARRMTEPRESLVRLGTLLPGGNTGSPSEFDDVAIRLASSMEFR